MNEKYKIRSCLCFVFRLKFVSESSKQLDHYFSWNVFNPLVSLHAICDPRNLSERSFRCISNLNENRRH